MSAAQSVGPQALPALQEQVEQILAEAKRQRPPATGSAGLVGTGQGTVVFKRTGGEFAENF